MKTSAEIKKTYLAMLIAIAKSDGDFNIWEEKYIDTIALKLSVNESEKDLIKDNPGKYMNALPDNYSQRIEFFYNLLFMMGIDNKVTREEKELCKQIGFKLCFNPMLMDDLLTIIIDNLGKDIPVEQVINAVIKYQN